MMRFHVHVPAKLESDKTYLYRLEVLHGHGLTLFTLAEHDQIRSPGMR